MSKETTEGAEPEAAAKKGGKGKAVFGAAALVIVGVVVGNKVLGGAPASAVSCTAPVEAEVEEPEPGPVLALDPITLNLADGHLLKVGLALELSAETASGGGGHGEAAAPREDDPTFGHARALDLAIGVFGAKTAEELAGEGREHAKDELEARLAEEYHGEVVGVLLHQFVIQ